MAALDRWNDDRLDDLHRMVLSIVPVSQEVPVVRAEMRSLTRELKELREGLQGVVGKPLEERRQRRNAILTGLVIAVVTAVATFLLTLAAGGGVH